MRQSTAIPFSSRFLPALAYLAVAFAVGLVPSGTAHAANVTFDSDTELSLSGLAATLYALAGSEADTVTVDGSTLTVDIPDGSSFTLGATSDKHNVVKVTPTGGTTTLTFEAENLSSAGYASKWTLDSSTATSWELLVGVAEANTSYQLKVEGSHYDLFISDNKGEFTFTYTDDFADRTFKVFTGGGGPRIGVDNPPQPPEGGFKITSPSSESAAEPLVVGSPAVQLEFNAGSDVTHMAISNHQDFSHSRKIAYETPKEWHLCQYRKDAFALRPPQDCEPGEYTLYTKFFTRYGVPSDPVSITFRYDPTAGAGALSSDDEPAQDDADTDEIARLKARIKELQLRLIPLLEELLKQLQTQIQSAT